jgi:hypothetical protein
VCSVALRCVPVMWISGAFERPCAATDVTMARRGKAEAVKWTISIGYKGER